MNEVESLTYGLNWSSCRLKDGADGSVEGRFSLFLGGGLFFMLCFYCVAERRNRKLTSAKTSHFSWVSVFVSPF